MATLSAHIDVCADLFVAAEISACACVRVRVSTQNTYLRASFNMGIRKVRCMDFADYKHYMHQLVTSIINAQVDSTISERKLQKIEMIKKFPKNFLSVDFHFISFELQTIIEVFYTVSIKTKVHYSCKFCYLLLSMRKWLSQLAIYPMPHIYLSLRLIVLNFFANRWVVTLQKTYFRFVLIAYIICRVVIAKFTDFNVIAIINNVAIWIENELLA